MKTAVTRADQDVARLDVALAERLGEPVDPRVRAIAELDRDALDDDRVSDAEMERLLAQGPVVVFDSESVQDVRPRSRHRRPRTMLLSDFLKRQTARERHGV